MASLQCQMFPPSERNQVENAKAIVPICDALWNGAWQCKTPVQPSLPEESFCGKPPAGPSVEYEECSAQACEGVLSELQRVTTCCNVSLRI